MHVDYKCEKCEDILNVEYSIKEGPPKEVVCPKCGAHMNRVWQVAVHIPEGFSDDLTTTIAQRMAHGARPTGKSKIIY